MLFETLNHKRSVPLGLACAAAVLFSGCTTPRDSVTESTPAPANVLLPSLITDTADEGFKLAVKMSRFGVKATQPDVEVLKRLRPEYSENAASLIAVSQVVATNFQTVAAANDYWR